MGVSFEVRNGVGVKIRVGERVWGRGRVVGERTGARAEARVRVGFIRGMKRFRDGVG